MKLPASVDDLSALSETTLLGVCALQGLRIWAGANGVMGLMIKLVLLLSHSQHLSCFSMFASEDLQWHNKCMPALFYREPWRCWDRGHIELRVVAKVLQLHTKVSL